MSVLDSARFFSPTDAAKYLGLGRSKVYELIAAGRIKVSRAAGPPRIDRAELDKFMGVGGTERPTDQWDEALNGGKPFKRPRRQAKAR